MVASALHAIVRHDAERLAALMAQIPRAERPDARQLALHAWQELEAETPSEPRLLTLAQALYTTLAPLDAGRPPLTVWQMRTARPLPEALRRTLVADRVLGWQQRFDRRWQVRMAMSAARLQWLESRVTERAPTQVAMVRPPEEAQNRESLELLHKRGRTRFS